MEAAIDQGGAPSRAEFHDAIARRADRWYAACLRITRSPDLAEDAVQDALLSAWNKRDQFESTARLDTWIHRIAINAALQLLRKAHPERYEALETEVADDTRVPESIISDGELEQNLAAALTQLTEVERICFVLKHLEQWRLKEIAERLDMNVGKVKQALFRGTKKLRVQMADLRS
jgi:RNA polymerase sigma-70 factor (ECF subfamily)